VYPDPESRHLRAALAEDCGIESEYILVGCGADELIDLIMRLASSSFMSHFLKNITPPVYLTHNGENADVYLNQVTKLSIARRHSLCMSLMLQ
jgi:hypothetical protein